MGAVKNKNNKLFWTEINQVCVFDIHSTCQWIWWEKQGCPKLSLMEETKCIVWVWITVSHFTHSNMSNDFYHLIIIAYMDDLDEYARNILVKIEENIIPFAYIVFYPFKILFICKKISLLRGSASQGNFFLLLNLEAWNLSHVCKIEIPWHFVHRKFSIFGL